MDNNIIIRQANISDLDALISISLQTYHETFFEAFDNEEQYQKYVSETFSVDRLSFELSDPDSLICFAQLQGKIVGYYKLNFSSSQSIFQGTKAAEVQNIYVLANYQGKQIGKLLLEHAIAVAKTCEVNYLWLAVWENNHKAIKFYEGNGMFKFDKYNYYISGELQKDLLMRIEIKNIPR